jgi:3-oxoacyl-[acyl-carrier-protein] synthase II
MHSKTGKVVVTSMGVSSPIGLSIKAFFENYVGDGRGASLKIEDKPLERELATFKHINSRRMDRITRIAMSAAASCWQDARLELTETTKNEVGGIFSTEYGPIASARNFINSGFELGLDSASPLLFPYTVGNAAPGAITILMGARGFNTTVSGHNPVAYAYDVIRSGKAKGILAGGFEELAPEIEEAYANRTITKGNAVVKEAAPIDAPSEGSAMLFMEEESFAMARAATILFEVCGYGACSNYQKEERSIDNFGFISDNVIGNSMKAALKNSDVSASQISLIISLSRKDSSQMASESKAIKSIWNDEVPKMHYVKQVIGETFGSSGCFAAIVGYLKGKELEPEAGKKKYVMVNSFHIGGNCFSIIIAI